MANKWYNKVARRGEITRFVETVLKKGGNVGEVGFIIKTNITIEPLDSIPDLTGKELVGYIRDGNYSAYADKPEVFKHKRFNLLAHSITGFRLYGDVIILKKN